MTTGIVTESVFTHIDRIEVVEEGVPNGVLDSSRNVAPADFHTDLGRTGLGRFILAIVEPSAAFLVYKGPHWSYTMEYIYPDT